MFFSGHYIHIIVSDSSILQCCCCIFLFIHLYFFLIELHYIYQSSIVFYSETKIQLSLFWPFVYLLCRQQSHEAAFNLPLLWIDRSRGSSPQNVMAIKGLHTKICLNPIKHLRIRKFDLPFMSINHGCSKAFLVCRNTTCHGNSRTRCIRQLAQYTQINL